MDGKKEFINNSCYDINVVLTVRAGEMPGCSLNIEEFCLKRFESKTICYGNHANPFLDAIQVCSHENGQFTESKLCVTKCGSAVDKLINTNYHIVFLNAGQSLVISGHK